MGVSLLELDIHNSYGDQIKVKEMKKICITHGNILKIVENLIRKMWRTLWLEVTWYIGEEHCNRPKEV
jgi:hypothetical protein